MKANKRTCNNNRGTAAALAIDNRGAAAALAMKRSAAALGLVVVAGCSTPPAYTPPPTGELSIDPGRVTIRRLNRSEYNNTVRDLLATSLRPADDFPPDEFAHGFDNNADVLTLSPVHLEVYQRAAEALIDEALQPGGSRSVLQAPAAGDFVLQSGATLRDSALVLTGGEAGVSLRLPAVGSYRVTVVASREAALPPDPAPGDPPLPPPPAGFSDAPLLGLHVNGFRLASFPVAAQAGAPGTFTATVDLVGGPSRFSVVLLNPFVDTTMAGYQRRLVVHSVKVDGPAGVVPESPQRRPLLACSDPGDREGCSAEVLGRFARRAFRRDVTAAEVQRLLAPARAAWAEGLSFEDGARLALQAVLLSPHFLFRPELDPDPRSLSAHRLSSSELASRLSYFLWSSMPDDELLDLATRDALASDEAVLRAQVTRMLRSPKAAALLDDFASEWLQLRDLATRTPDRATFPAWTPALRDSIIKETRGFFSAFLADDAPPAELLLRADYTYVDSTAAAFYGLRHPGGAELVKVPLGDSLRAGILGQASLLSVTSHPTRTSPVKRGKWVLEQLLCAPPPGPPANVPPLEESAMPGSTVRQQLEAHRSQPACAGCHRPMDPIGFGLENFDAIGAFRREDAGQPIDAAGEMPDGRAFNGPRALAEVLARDPRFPSCLTEKLFVYALGRGPRDSDPAHIAKLSDGFQKDGGRLRDLLRAITQSDAFRSRRGEPDDVDSNGGTP